MSDLFLPKEVSKKSLEGLLNPTHVFGREPIVGNALVFASKNNIYAMADFETVPKFICERGGEVNCLVYNPDVHDFYGCNIFDAGDYNNIFDTLTNESFDVHWKSGALCSHGGHVFHAYDTSSVCDERPYRVSRMLRYFDVPRRKNFIFDIESHGGKVYDAGGGRIFDSFSGKIVRQRPGAVFSLCSFGDHLFDAGDYANIYDTLTNKPVQTAWPDNPVVNLFSHGPMLYYIDNKGGVFDVLNNEQVFAHEELNCMISVPVKEVDHKFYDAHPMSF